MSMPAEDKVDQHRWYDHKMLHACQALSSFIKICQVLSSFVSSIEMVALRAVEDHNRPQMHSNKQLGYLLPIPVSCPTWF